GRLRIETSLQVPTRFSVPVAGRLVWNSVPGWKLNHRVIPFHLQPGQPLQIPLQAEVEPGPYERTPALTIAFDAGQFRNRLVEVYPFKLAGPETIPVVTAKPGPVIDGRLDDACWTNNPRAPWQSLLGLPPRGGRDGQVRLATDGDWLYIAAKLAAAVG